MPFWAVKFSVSPVMKPGADRHRRAGEIAAAVDIAERQRGIERHRPPPPVKVAVPPAVTVGATCTVSTVLVAACWCRCWSSRRSPAS